MSKREAVETGPLMTALMAGLQRTAPQALSAVEERILAIACKLMHEAVGQQAYNEAAKIWQPGTDIPIIPITPLMFSDAAEYAIVAAVAIEKHLRDVREGLAK